MDIGSSLTEKGIQFLDGLFPVEQIVEITSDDDFKYLTPVKLAGYNVASAIRREAGFYNQEEPLSEAEKIKVWNNSVSLAASYIQLHIDGLHRRG